MEKEDTSVDMFLSKLADFPYDVNVIDFAKYRAQELKSLTECIESPSGNRRVFQQLPRHMRRRTQSHNVKRVPRRVQEAHKRELLKSAKKKESKRPPSRRHRRRPKHLLLDYNRRQRVFIWLETHIWHAKRFKMSSRWGYKIPLHPCDKLFRSCYRGATRTAFLQDVSYYCCLEIKGKKEDILTVLRQMTSSDVGLTFEAVKYDKGQYEGNVVLYRRNEYPYGAIGEVKFMWRPLLSNNDDDKNKERRSLWIWIHPCSYEELLMELSDGFQLEREVKTNGGTLYNSHSEMVVDGKPETKMKGQLDKEGLLNDKAFVKLAPKLKPFYEQSPTYVGDCVTLTVLKDTLVRFRLAGQLSTSILSEVLKEATVESADNGEGQERWWQKLKPASKKACLEQQTLWSNIRKTPIGSHLPPNCIISLIVHDPREDLPTSRSKLFPEVPGNLMGSEFLPQNLSEMVSRSLLWHQNVREEVTFTKKTDQELNVLRSQHLVPGTQLNLEEKGSRIPVILIQNPGNGKSDIGIGWDLILPAGWAMPFWISLVYRNARVGGYREGTTIVRQLGTPCFPEDFPDTAAGRLSDSNNRETLTNKYFRYPPDKRPNYIKLGILAPFHCPWNVLVNEWKLESEEHETDAENENDFFVLRDRAVLRQLQRFCDQCRGEQNRKRPAKAKTQFRLDDIMTVSNSRSLVGLRLKTRSKGILNEFALVCLPKVEDLQQLDKDKLFVGPCEPPHRDVMQKHRKKLKQDLKTVKRRSKSNKNGTNERNPLEKELMEKIGSKQPQDYQKEIENLLIPATVDKIVKSSCRDVIGFIKTGGFSLVEGNVTGLAYVALPALIRLLNEASKMKREPIALVRSTRSLQYRFVNFNIM